MKKTCLLLSLLLGAGSLIAQPVADVVLYLSVDVSGSVDSTEYDLQKTGYANAFKSTAIKDLFEDPADDDFTLAVTYSEWSTSAAANTVGWQFIDSAADSEAFGVLLDGIVRASGIGSSTGIGEGITYASDYISTSLTNNEFTLATDSRVIIDVSGDGTENVADPGQPSAARDAALAADVDRINGLAILTGVANLDDYYEANVAGGAGSFVVAAADFDDFASAVAQKIRAEITDTGIPEPGTIGLLGVIGIAGFLYYNRRRTAKTAAA